MKPRGETLRAYAELARISNLPTCVSNSLVGCALGAAGGAFPWTSFPPIAAAVCLFYAAGMALNDIADQRFDQIERPERPIPSGRVSLAEARVFAAAAALLGVGVLARTTLAAMVLALLLVVLIALYDLFHKRHPTSVVLMGACRGMVYLVAAAAISSAISWFRVVWLAGTLGVYTVAITVVARLENVRLLDARRWVALALPPMVLTAAVAVPPRQALMPSIAGLVLVLWLARAAKAVLRTPPNTRAAIQIWISGMSLIDAFFLTLLDQPLAALVALACFGLAAYSHRMIAGT
jgi:4-hydroxybenzoate polyprenyltransferase